MSLLPPSAGALIRHTTAMCRQCRGSIPAEIRERGGQVWMDKTCPEHGDQQVVLCTSASWYRQTVAQGAALTRPVGPHAVRQGCPFDCGPCTQHQQRIELPIVPITSSCNLACPICYTHNRNGDAYQMSEAELDAILEHLARLQPSKRIINLTGGEPTGHPDFLRLLRRCAEAGIQRVTLSTHGMGLTPDVLEELARIDARVILSFDSFDDGVNQQMLGGRFAAGKLAALRRLGEHGVRTTLLPVIAHGRNHTEVGRIVRFGLDTAHVRSVELHTMAYTGQYGRSFAQSDCYGPYEILRDLEEQTEGQLRIDDFCPVPSAHPLCYQAAYLIRLPDGGWLPLGRFMTVQERRSVLEGSLYLAPDARTEAVIRSVLTELWTGERTCADRDAVLAALRGVLEAVTAPEEGALTGLQRAEELFKAVYVHAHMDEDTFEVERIRQCCVSIVEPTGQTIPSCAYNILYRNRDERFTVRPLGPLSTLGPGHLPES